MMKDAIITSSILILCIVLLRRLCKGKISAGLQYALWLVVALRLIMPCLAVVFPHILPESDFSIMNVADRAETALQGLMEPLETEHTQVRFIEDNFTFDELPFLGETGADGPTAVFVAGRITWTWIDWLKIIWYGGMAVAGIWMLAVNIRFFYKLKKERVKYETTDCRLPVYTAKNLPSPCLYGLPGNQSIYLPEDVADDEEKVKHILAHEYCHYRHGDVFWSALRCILLTVYWFHPLVWLAAVLSKQDCELACDEAVIRMLGEDERIAYGKTLVSLITRKATASDIMCAATTMTGGAGSVKERLQRIVEKPQRLAVVLVLCLAVIGIAAVFTFTQAKEYPDGTYLLEGESTRTVTTSCFQITFPASFIKKAYCRGENGTDVIVYHKASDREIGRFCMMDYEEAKALADKREVIPVGTYGSSPNLRTYLNKEAEQERLTEETTRHEYHEEEHTYYPEEVPSGGNEEAPGGGNNHDGSVGVPGTDSNAEDERIYLVPDESAEDTMAQQSNGDIYPIPAPEEVEKEVINLPYDSEVNYSAANIDEEKTDLPNEEIIVEDSVDYLPNETITEVYVSVDAPCYLYIPADNTDAEEEIQAELMNMNRELEELAESVTILYQRRESMMRVLNILVANRTPYIGDAVKASKIASALPVASGLGYQYLSLETATEPYSVTLYYQMQVDNAAQISADTQFLEAALMFAAVENLEYCNIQIKKAEEEESGDTSDFSGEYENVTYERSHMEEMFGELYPYSESEESMVELYQKILEYLEEKNGN
ncbi:MAG: DUF4825 domain-containing protein [Bacillus sp. (in: Bacteria)]|nr:DUF4825 domain-containing protein [Bacillus sp. (in: firmicutes)]MCM1425425.1 DUF4825 domain-containing protein [Eubacterium sp.]